MQNTINLRISSVSDGRRPAASAATQALDIGSGAPSHSVHTPHRGIWRPQRGHTVPDMAALPRGLPGVGCVTSPVTEGVSCEEASCCVSGRVQ